MVAELAAAIVAVLATGAELIHLRRIRKIAPLAFGPRRRPALWAEFALILRVASLAAVCWGLITLMLLEPKVHHADIMSDAEMKHVVLVLDVSPSMRLQDAGPESKQSRMARASDVMESFFKRVAIQQYRLSVVAFYTGAKPVVVDTSDVEVVRNILNDLPMHYAFQAGDTDLFAGLNEAARMSRPWRPASTTVIVVSDGDTVPAKGMPKMPAAVRDVVVVGVGDPLTGKFINGRQSRQDASTLRQVANRLSGTYHNGNESHLSTGLLKQLTQSEQKSAFEKLTTREFAIVASLLGAMTYALLPVMLHLFGTFWNPGVRVARQSQRGESVCQEGAVASLDYPAGVSQK